MSQDIKDINIKVVEGGFTECNLDYIFKGLSAKITERTRGTLFKMVHALESYQAEVQIQEGRFYDIELINPKDNDNFVFGKKQSFIQPRVQRPEFATLAPNFYVGTLSIPIFLREKRDECVGEFQIEVRSRKTDYDNEYKFMLDDISSKCIDLLFQVESPISQTFESDIHQIDEKAIYQKFVFVKSIVDSKEFEESIQKIISNPSTKWETETQEKDIRNIKRFSARNIRELSSRTNRVKLENKICGLDSIPLKLTSSRKIESIDTPENRFIKHVISTFLSFSEDCENALINYTNKNSKRKEKIISIEAKDARRIIEKLDNIINQPFFNDISRPTTLKINSPVLQKRSGYRELLKYWLRFDLAAKLVWKGGDDVYKGGKKNIAALYEYWLFFVLYELFNNKFKFTSIQHDGKPKEENILKGLFVQDNSKLGLNLISGKDTSIIGVYDSGIRKFNVNFSFNKTFGKTDFPNSGSWTKKLRPDYTISIWPLESTIDEAEQNESIVHIHFDSKYKLDYFNVEIFDEEAKPSDRNDDEINDNEEDFNESMDALEKEKALERKNTYKNADLYKMHTYKDAIRRTGGAYILYPGDSERESLYKGFHEILPGLGAFAIKPLAGGIAKAGSYKELNDFINKIIEHFEHRLTQRERISDNLYKIVKEEPILYTPINLPDFIDKGNKFIPSQTYVLIGYYKSLEHKQWIMKHNKYNIRFGHKQAITNEMINAKFVLLYNETIGTPFFLKIESSNPQVYTKNDLEGGYPNPTSPNYLVYDVKENNVEELNNLIMSKPIISKLKERKVKDKNAFLPFAVSFETLLLSLKEDV